MNADGTGQTRLTNDAAVDRSPAWSPDGSKVAFESRRDGNAEIYVMNADGSGQTNLTNSAGSDASPAWSPDGTTLAFESSRDGLAEIYLMDADGFGVTALTADAGNNITPAWSPDGTKLAFASTRAGNLDVYIMNADGTGATNLTASRTAERAPAWSPDGSKLAFEGVADSDLDVYVVNADGSGRTNLTNAPGTNRAVDWQRVAVPAAQTVAFLSTPPAPAHVNGTYAASAAGGGSGNAVVVSASPAAVCTASEGVVTFVGVGTCTVAAHQAGGGGYLPADPVTQVIPVDYRFEGFAAPVDNGGLLNSARAGQAIPLKWRLTDAHGAPVTTLASAAVAAAGLACDLGGDADALEAYALAGSGLQNLGGGYYQLNWKSPSAYAKSCKTLRLDLGEGGGPRTALFQFTK
jgi:TolB protein